MNYKLFVFSVGAACAIQWSVAAQPTPPQLAAADAGQLPTINFDSLPPFGTWWSWSMGLPMPFDIWPDMVCYDLGDGFFLLDDRTAKTL